MKMMPYLALVLVKINLRLISLGIEIRESFLDMFENFSMGITTGVVSFGGVGAVGRAEYAVV